MNSDPATEHEIDIGGKVYLLAASSRKFRHNIASAINNNAHKANDSFSHFPDFSSISPL